jgi:hypothetical protein
MALDLDPPLEQSGIELACLFAHGKFFVKPQLFDQPRPRNFGRSAVIDDDETAPQFDTLKRKASSRIICC